MATDIAQLREFLTANVSRIDDHGGHGSPPSLPDYELFARDFLEFAEREIAGSSPQSRVNCVSNLKRAIDCQVDTFLHVFNLRKTFEKKGLGLDARLRFLRAAGVFSSRTLARIVKLRNEMEHEYKVPVLEDVELYFDLVSSFVAVLERTIAAVWPGQHDFALGDDFLERISTKFLIDKPEITIAVQSKTLNQEFTATPADSREFAYLFRVYSLLVQYKSFVSRRHMATQLGDIDVS